jgi:transglutaminase-like putative cysteine protease
VRFGVVHRFMTNALAAFGVLALVSSGQFSRAVSTIVVVGLVAALSVRESWQQHRLFKHADTTLILAILAVQILRFSLGASGLDVIIEFAVGLQLVRLATRRGAAHDQQVIVLALLHLIAGTVLGGGLGYGLCFAGVLVVAPGALVLSHLRREVEGNYRQGARDRTGLPVDVPRILRSRRVVGRGFLLTTCLLSVPIFLFTAVLFVVFPRVGLSLLLLNRGNNERYVGFSDRVDLGGVGVLRDDPTVAMRVSLPHLGESPPARLTMHLRGTALDRYDDGTWSRTQASRPPETGGTTLLLDPPRHAEPDAPVMRVEREGFDPPVLFVPPNARMVRLRGRDVALPSQQSYAYRGAEGELRFQAPEERGIGYEVLLSDDGRPAFTRLDPSERHRYTQLPADLSPRIRELAQAWTEGASGAREAAAAIEAKLRDGYRYDTSTPSSTQDEPLEHFLFESKRGHCEFYSTALAVMLRTLDVPTRNVTGFVGGTWNKFGQFYVVRQGDAHSWVEVFVDGTGWVTFDPTPPADAAPRSATTGAWAWARDLLEATSQRWDRHVVGYDLEQQYGLLRKVSDRESGASPWSTRRTLIGGGVVLVAIALGGWFARRKSQAPAAPPSARSARSRSERTATALYEELESALTVQGITRAPGTPPLRHAEALFASDHPLGAEVLELTQRYLDARFGGVELSDDDVRSLTQRVRAIQRLPRPRPAS